MSALIRANDLSKAEADNFPDGRRLRIPSVVAKIVASPTMSRRARLSKDNVSVRTGPGSDRPRVMLADVGTRLTVTAKRSGWVQVRLPGGKQGWVRADFVAYGGHTRGKDVASSATVPARKGGKGRHHASVVATDEDRNRRRKRTARHAVGSSVRISKVHHQHQKPQREAKAERRHRDAQRYVRSLYLRHSMHHSVASHRAQRHAHTARLAHAHGYLARLAHLYRQAHQRVARAGRRARWFGHAVAAAVRNSGDLVRTAYAYRGTPYVWGGEGRGGFDCSGFTSYLYRKKGVNLPHSARAQFHEGHSVSRSEMKPGDLVFFHTVTSGISHVGLYVGNGHFVHASSRKHGVREDSLSSGYYSRAFRGARRFQR